MGRNLEPSSLTDSKLHEMGGTEVPLVRIVIKLAIILLSVLFFTYHIDLFYC